MLVGRGGPRGKEELAHSGLFSSCSQAHLAGSHQPEDRGHCMFIHRVDKSCFLGPFSVRACAWGTRESDR